MSALNQTINQLAHAAGPAVLDVLSAAAFGLAIAAALFQLQGRMQKKALFDKIAQQFAGIGFIFSLLTAGVMGILLYFSGVEAPEAQAFMLEPGSPGLSAVLLTGLYAVLMGVYRFTFRPMRKNKGAHTVIGVVCALCSVAAIYAYLGAAALLLKPDMAEGARWLVFFSTKSAAWPAFALSLVLCVCYGCALGMLYSLYRRNKDDFGRDYYRFALNNAAKLAATCALIQLLLQGWLLSSITPEIRSAFLDQAGIPLLAGDFVALLSAVGWLALARSSTPMRLKGLVFGGAVAVWLIDTCFYAAAMVLTRLVLV